MNQTNTIETFAPVPPDTHPPLDYPGYRSSVLRHPNHDPIRLDRGKLDRNELDGPLFGEGTVTAAEADLTIGPGGEAVGQRIIVHGRMLDAGGRPIAGSLIEIWQSNASGRYRHVEDRWPGTLDPNFTGAGRCLTAGDGSYRFTTIRPGAYPWRNHPNAWRPAHIHFSVFGRSFSQRLVTQMYFPDDPLFFQDPIFNSIPERSRPAAIAAYDHETTTPEWALGFRFDIVLRGPDRTPFENEEGR
jgi:protocatechuate 3,4-dioxygenase beta subunit